MKPRIAGIGLATLAAACAGPPETPFPTGVREVESPTGPGSSAPFLESGADGGLYLTWVEPDADADALRFARWEGGAWSPARTIARGTDWFVNWADVPAIAALGDGTLAAHWLAKTGTDPYAYGVRVAVSRDGGATWSAPVVPHRDGTPTEHGFVSFAPEDDGFSLAWLDGREMVDGGAMTLRSATMDRDAAVGPEVVIDSRVCECCPTDAVRTADGAIVVAYRDRSEREVRDVFAARRADDGWSEPVRVHDDGWEIAGCPVNGPALGVQGDALACAWFTRGRSDRPEVRLAFSRDHGRTWGAPIRVDDGNPIGRVDVLVGNDGSAVVSWLESTGEEAEVRIRQVHRSGKQGPALSAARVPDSRASGYPRLAPWEGGAVVAWVVPGDPSEVRTALLQ